MARRVLVSWIGHNDLRAMATSLPAKQRAAVENELGRLQSSGENGPIKTLVDAESFDEVHLLSNYRVERNRQYRRWLGGETSIHRVGLDDPTDYGRIFTVADEFLSTLARDKLREKTELCIHLSPGSPAMAAVWLLLGKSRYPATFFQTHNGRSWVTDVPFDLAVDYVPHVLRAADEQFQHLSAKSPAELRGFQMIEGDSRAIRLAAGRARRAALRNVPVLILGETGTGKEMFAQAIHTASSRKSKPFRAVNCAAMPKELLDSELFGHKKGAFTGAISDRMGAFEEADGGTLFLDEVGECDSEMQAKLLRVLQPPPGEGPCYRVFQRLGDSTPIVSDVRVVAATNRDLIEAVAEHEFREDLYYRLAVITIKLPPLRERRGDIPNITKALLKQINELFSKDEPGYQDKSISAAAMEFVKRHSWPGNVRQLYNILLQAAVMTEGQKIGRSDLVDALAEMPEDKAANVLEHPLGEGFVLDEHLNNIHRHYLRRAMGEAGGVKTRAAKLLGMKNYQTLDAQLRRLNVDITL